MLEKHAVKVSTDGDSSFPVVLGRKRDLVVEADLIRRERQ